MDLLLLLTLISACLASGHTVASYANEYWKTELDDTPMPKAIIDSLAGLRKDGIVDANPFVTSQLHPIIDKHDLSKVFTYHLRDDVTTTGDGNELGARGPQATNIDKLLLHGELHLFFSKNRLTHTGGKMKLHFNSGYKTKFLPLQVAKSIPFSHDRVAEILDLFSVRPDSKEGKIIEEVVKYCEESPVEGEDKYCATSLEDLIDYVKSSIGSQVRVFSTTMESKTIMEYTIEKAQKVSSDSNLVCHKMKYPYAVFRCHSVRNTDVYAVSLIDANGKKGRAVAVCPNDTSSWDPKHLAFRILQVKPGSTPICHFLWADDMIWTPKKTFMPRGSSHAQSI